MSQEATLLVSWLGHKVHLMDILIADLGLFFLLFLMWDFVVIRCCFNSFFHYCSGNLCWMAACDYHYIIQQSSVPKLIAIQNWHLLGIRTLSWSPSKSCKKLACVPVVPFTPRNLNSSRARSRLWRSMQRSWIHRQQRLPTVVSWAGLKEHRILLKNKPVQLHSCYYTVFALEALQAFLSQFLSESYSHNSFSFLEFNLAQ